MFHDRTILLLIPQPLELGDSSPQEQQQNAQQECHDPPCQRSHTNHGPSSSIGQLSLDLKRFVAFAPRFPRASWTKMDRGGRGPGAYATDDAHVGKKVVKDFDGAPYWGQVYICCALTLFLIVVWGWLLSHLTFSHMCVTR